jgi:glycosyltransferase involved in cell wall biosynthesis
MRHYWGCDESDLVVGYIGRIAPEKNCLAVARSVKGLGRRGIGVVYGSCASQARDILADIRSIAGDQVRVFDPTEDVGSILHAIDVFLLLSHTEGLSSSLLEAWAAGVPVVASPVGALPDLERQFGRLAVLAEPDASEETLAVAALEALNGAAKGEIRRRAQDVVWNHFTAGRMAMEWTDYLEFIVGMDNCLNGASGPGRLLRE